MEGKGTEAHSNNRGDPAMPRQHQREEWADGPPFVFCPHSGRLSVSGALGAPGGSEEDTQCVCSCGGPQ